MRKATLLQLDTTMPPDARTLDIIRIPQEQISYQGIKFEITIKGQTMCGCGQVTPCQK